MPDLRYVILRHEGVAQPHFDLMFETAPGSPLVTWQSPQWPVVGRIEVVRLPDHRAAYLDYDGPVSGGRGSVRRVDAGECSVEQSERGAWTIRLSRSAPTPAPAPVALVLEPLDGGRWQLRVES